MNSGFTTTNLEPYNSPNSDVPDESVHQNEQMLYLDSKVAGLAGDRVTSEALASAINDSVGGKGGGLFVNRLKREYAPNVQGRSALTGGQNGGLGSTRKGQPSLSEESIKFCPFDRLQRKYLALLYSPRTRAKSTTISCLCVGPLPLPPGPQEEWMATRHAVHRRPWLDTSSLSLPGAFGLCSS
ncbi:hypothetical protein J6590_004511 [Homalodisca vitripennis]|nr:hypothetical protein J6590_004511 [Homalodisca vitripennis]